MFRTSTRFSSLREQLHGQSTRSSCAAGHGSVLQTSGRRKQFMASTVMQNLVRAASISSTSHSLQDGRQPSAGSTRQRVNTTSVATLTQSTLGTSSSRRSNHSNSIAGQGRTTQQGVFRHQADPRKSSSNNSSSNSKHHNKLPAQQQQLVPPHSPPQSLRPPGSLLSSSSRSDSRVNNSATASGDYHDSSIRPGLQGKVLTDRYTAGNGSSSTVPGASLIAPIVQRQPQHHEAGTDFRRRRQRQQSTAADGAVSLEGQRHGSSSQNSSSMGNSSSSSSNTPSSSSSSSSSSTSSARGIRHSSRLKRNTQQPKLPGLSWRSADTTTSSGDENAGGRRLPPDDAAVPAVAEFDQKVRSLSPRTTTTTSRSRSIVHGQQRGRSMKQQRSDQPKAIIAGKHSSSTGTASKAAANAVQGLRYKSFEELSDIARRYGSTTSLTNLMAMFSRLKIVPWGRNKDKAELLQVLWQHLQPQLSKASPRHCAEAMLTASKLQAPLKDLFEQCLSAIVSKIDSAEPRILSNAIYAVGTAAGPITRDAGIRTAVEQQLLPVFANMEGLDYPQAVSNVVYAAAVLGVNSGSLDVQRLLQGLNSGFWVTGTTQELSNTLWGVAELGQSLQREQLQAVLDALVQKLHEAKPIHITNTLWAVCTMGQQLEGEQVQQLAAAMLQKPLYARVIGSVLWSVGKLGHQLPQQQVTRFMDLLVADLVSTPTGAGRAASSSSRPSSSSLKVADSTIFSKAQAISNALHGVVTMKCTASKEHVDQLLAVLVTEAASESADCNPQALANTLWSIATLKVQINTYHLDQIYSSLSFKLKTAEPQAVANAFWAAGTFVSCYLPSQLLTNEAVQYIVQELVPAMKPQELSNIAFACGMLSHLDTVLMDAILKQTVQILNSASATATAGSGSSTRLANHLELSEGVKQMSPAFGLQSLCLICWAGAVLNMQDHVVELQAVASHCSSLWSSVDMVAADKVQLFQLHVWLVEQCGLQEGLLGQLSQQQIDECKEERIKLVRTLSKASYTQQIVYEAALQVPELQDVKLEVTTRNRLWSTDISATVADERKRKLAIEVDGPFHYRRPDHAPTGPTVVRNMALASAGYVVVTVPWWEWSEFLHHDMSQKVTYLRGKVQQGLQDHEPSTQD